MTEKTQSTYDCIIVGGGISGISFAHYLHSIGKKVIVLEKEHNIGGQVQTRYVPIHDLWYELGSHTCYNSYVSLLNLAQSIQFTDNILSLGKPHSYRIYTKEKELKKMFAAISCFPIILRSFNFLFTSKSNKSVKEYYSKIFGSKEYDKIFSKMFRAVLSQNADDYPAELFLKKRKTRLKEYPRKYTFKSGLLSLLNAIVEQDGFCVKTSCEVTQIERLQDSHGKSYYEVRSATGEKYTAPALAIAIPPQSASALLEKQESALANQLSALKSYHSESLNVVVKKESLQVPEMVGIISLADDFLSVISSDLVPHPTLRSFTFHFAEGDKTETEKLETVCKTLGIKQTDIIEKSMTNHVLPSLRMTNLGMNEKVTSSKLDDNLYVLGNYFNGVSLEDCVSRSEEEFERYKKNNEER